MGLLRVPRTAARTAKRRRARASAKGVGPARGQIDEQRREVVGRDHAVGFGQRDSGDLLVGSTEVMEHHHLVVRPDAIEEGELHVRQHERGVELREQDRATGFQRTGMRARPSRRGADERVDPEPRPREVGERQPWDDLELDLSGPLALAEQDDGPLRDHGAARDRVGDRAACSWAAATSESTISRYTDSGSGAPLVDVVEGGERHAVRRELVDGRVPRGARGPHRRARQRGAGRGQEEIGAGRTQPDDDDPGHPRLASCSCSRGAGRREA